MAGRLGKTNSKRTNANEGDVSSKWTIVEQNALQKLVDTGAMSLNDSASKAKACDPSLENFSNSVIGYHLGVIRKKEMTIGYPRNAQSGAVAPVHDALSQYGVIPNNSVSHNNQPCSVEFDDTKAHGLSCEHMPFLRFSYMQYQNKQEKVVVLVDLPGGSASYDWEFNDDGNAITIVAGWSTAIYDVSNLFARYLNLNLVNKDDPKLHAMQTEILRQGYSARNVPKCHLNIDLGVRVQKEDGSWKLDTALHAGNKILIFEFSGYQEDSLKTDKSGTF